MEQLSCSLLGVLPWASKALLPALKTATRACSHLALGGAAAELGGVAGEDVSSADGEVELGRGVGREVHCGFQKVGVILVFRAHAAFSLGCCSKRVEARARETLCRAPQQRRQQPSHACNSRFDFRGISSLD